MCLSSLREREVIWVKGLQIASKCMSRAVVSRLPKLDQLLASRHLLANASRLDITRPRRLQLLLLFSEKGYFSESLPTQLDAGMQLLSAWESQLPFLPLRKGSSGNVNLENRQLC